MTEEEPVAFGALLRRLRLAAGLTQEELAERARLSDRAIRRLERDLDRTPRLQTVRLVSQALDLSAEQQSRLLDAARPAQVGHGLSARAAPLPRFLVPLIGREEDIAITRLLLEDCRLVTVSGTGGVGKTRLALALGNELSSAFDRVVFVELAPLRDPGQVLGSIAGSLSIREVGARPLFAVVADTLRAGRILLVLDNMEHLLAARDTVLQLLAACPELRILITSREALRVRGEHVYTLGPLSLPERELDIGRSPAVRLFLDRARDAGATLEWDEVTGKVAADICRRLDGLPLAIELAAAWTAVLSPVALLARLTSRLPYLDHGPRDLPARQRTMRDTIAWSYDLLSPPEQILFRRLAVFAGGCTLAAAEAVCRGVGHLELDMLQGFASLVSKSLLTGQDAVGAEPEPRFGMLETVREFAYEKLLAASEAEAAEREHTGYFLSLAREAEHALSGARQSVWLGRLEQDHDNLRAVLHRAQQEDDIGLGLELTGCLWPFWWARNYYDELQRWLEAFLPRAESVGVSPAVRAHALHAAGALAPVVRVDTELRLSLLREALILARQAGDEACAAATLQLLGAIEQSRGNYPLAEELYDESLTTYQRLNDQAGVCAVLSALAGLARYQGDYDRATSLYEEALAIGRSIGDARKVADVLARLGSMETERGRPLQARPVLEEALALHHELGDVLGVGDILLRSGEVAADMGSFAEAMALHKESLEIFRDLGTSYAVPYVLIYQAEAALGMGDLDQARELADESLPYFRGIGDRRSIGEALLQLADVARERQSYGQALTLYEECLTLHCELNTRPHIAQCLERMALLASLQGSEDRTARLCGAASALRKEMDSEMAPADRPLYGRCMAAVRNRIGETAFAAGEAEGRAMSLEQAVAFALGRQPSAAT